MKPGVQCIVLIAAHLCVEGINDMSAKITRRTLLRGAALTAVLGAGGDALTTLSSAAVGPRLHDTGCDTLVVLFLRGGADGLNIVAPYGDDYYYKLRPSLALAAPRSAGKLQSACLTDLNGFFGLHPAMAPLIPLYREGMLLPIHAVGSNDHTLSHFQAMAAMERGLAQDGTGAVSGWLARHLDVTAPPSPSPLRAVALGETLPASLRGATGVTALNTLSDYRLMVPAGTDGKVFHSEERMSALENTLNGMYENTRAGSLSMPAKETLHAIETVSKLDPAHYKPSPNAHYPATGLSHSLQQVACMIKGEVGLEAATIDVEGWDTHVAQGSDTGWQASRLADLAGALAAFAADLGTRMQSTTVVTMTEFGRRAYENTGLGTDHGRGSVMFLLGGGIDGGRVYAKWPGLGPDKLVGPGNLHVTTDYRDVLGEIVERRLHNTALDIVFPGLRPVFPGVVRV